MLYKRIIIAFLLIIAINKIYAAEQESYNSTLFVSYSSNAMGYSDNLKLSTNITNDIILGTGIFTSIFSKNVLLYSKAGMGFGSGSNQKDKLTRSYILIGFDYYDNPLAQAIYRNNILSTKHRFLIGGAIGYLGISNEYSNINPQNIGIDDKLYYSKVKTSGSGVLIEFNLGYEYAFYKNHSLGINLSMQSTVGSSFNINSVSSNNGAEYPRFYNNIDSSIFSTSINFIYKYFIKTKI